MSTSTHTASDSYQADLNPSLEQVIIAYHNAPRDIQKEQISYLQNFVAVLQADPETPTADSKLPAPLKTNISSSSSSSILALLGKRKRDETPSDIDDTFSRESTPPPFTVTLQIIPSVSRDELSSRVSAFRNQLSVFMLPPKTSKKNMVKKPTLSPQIVRSQIDLLFTHMFGQGFVKRLCSLVKEYYSMAPKDTSPAILASAYASDSSIPAELRIFFERFSTVEGKRETVEKDTVSAQILGNLSGYELYAQYQDLIGLVEATTKTQAGHQLCDFLKTQGFHLAQGRTYRTVIQKYLARNLGLSSKELTAKLGVQVGIFILVEKLGKGVLVLLPNFAGSRLKKMGSQKLTHILNFFLQSLPEAIEICKAAELAILEPLIASRHLIWSDDEPSTDNRSLLEIIRSVGNYTPEETPLPETEVSEADNISHAQRTQPTSSLSLSQSPSDSVLASAVTRTKRLRSLFYF